MLGGAAWARAARGGVQKPRVAFFLEALPIHGRPIVIYQSFAFHIAPHFEPEKDHPNNNETTYNSGTKFQ